MGDAIIFLDMDGVISTRRAWLAQTHKRLPHRWIDAGAMQNLNRLSELPGIRVVVSSTWRLSRTRQQFHTILARNGFMGRLHRDWRTAALWENGPDTRRGDEVREWLSRHPEITSHVILDDDADFYPNQPLVLTEFECGLTRAHVDVALALLERVAANA